MLAVLFIDLDGFKYVNDTLGHSAGDKLLLQVAERLKKHGPENTLISRLGGDEFTVLLYNLDHWSEIYEKTKSILKLFQPQFTIDGVNFSITASIGISLYPYEGKTPEELLIYADTAMYKAKQSGKNKFCFYNYTPNIC
jgi:diguanylate cyclase (GGDEF)-like protein